MPITAENVFEENVGLSCEMTSGLEPMTADAQVESAPAEGGSQSLDGTVVVLVPITVEIVHAGTVGRSCELTSRLEHMTDDSQIESAPAAQPPRPRAPAAPPAA